jgi:5,5'-dehydrodivanillate O-demethylase oxygenase subunit
MLTREENELLTRVDPGTPGGELLRRYWQPVAPAAELTAEKPIKAVRLLGEDLVLYRDTKGGYGLVGRQCPHRRASLAYGRVDDEGIRCPYHGWKFDAAGKCLEMPAEPADTPMKSRIRQKAYPVQKLGGMLFSYMGPDPVPLLPRWDVLAWEQGKRWIDVQSVLQCSWLQAMENSVDPAHLFWLHGAFAHLANAVGHYEEDHEFLPFGYGIVKRRTTPARKPGDKAHIDQHPLLFPNTLRHVSKSKVNGRLRHNLQFRVPIDNVSTQVFVVYFEPSDTEHTSADADVPFGAFPLRDADGAYRLDQVLVQDAMAWESQGEIADRTQENLGSSDRGVAMFRRLLKDQIAAVQNGKDPLGVVRDEKSNRLIEFEVINERIGLVAPQKQAVA